MSRFLVLFGSLILFFLSFGEIKSAPAGFDPEHYRAEYLRVYLTALTIADPDAPRHYVLNTPEDEEELFAEINRLAARHDGSTLDNVDEGLRERVENYLLPEIWRIKEMTRAREAAEEFRQYYESRKTEFPVRDWVRGARILVEYGEGAEAEAEALARRLEEGGGFRVVAREYYRSMGEDHDGSIGLVQRGQIRDPLFEIFMEQEVDEPFFGPVRSEHGFLLGKIDAKGEEGYLPWEEVADRLRGDFVASRLEEAERRVVEWVEEEGLLVREEVPGREGPPRGSTPAYRFDGELRTYADVQRALPGVFGDASSWRYFDALRERAITAEAVRAGPVAEAVRESEAWEVLYGAAMEYAAVTPAMKDALAEAAEAATEEVLREYYDERKNLHYRRTPEVRIVHVRVSRNPEGTTDPIERRDASRRAWETIQEIYRDFSRSDDPGGFSFEGYRDRREVRIRDASRWVSIDSLPPEIGRRLRENPDQRFSDFMISRIEYSFYYLVERRHPLYPPFEDIQERVRADFLEEHRQRVRAEYLGGEE